jgi:hypothetical protein
MRTSLFSLLRLDPGRIFGHGRENGTKSPRPRSVRNARNGRDMTYARKAARVLRVGEIAN